MLPAYLSGRPPGFQKPADIQDRIRTDRRECLRVGGQTPLACRTITVRDWLCWSAGAEFVPIADYLRPRERAAY